MTKTKLNVVGIMSGTSFDGVDFILCSCEGKDKIEFKDSFSIAYPQKIKAQLFKLTPQSSIEDMSELDFQLGIFYKSAFQKAVSKKKWKVDLIGLHGQTVFHNPPQTTLQIGNPHYLTSFAPVVHQFRKADLIELGQGAPLAPFFHEVIKPSPSQPIAFQNLGGFANITYLSKEKKLSFDNGPANVFIDLASQKFLKKDFDKDGTFAQKGIPDLTLANKWIDKIAFFNKKPPKSCGRSLFSNELFEKCLKDMKGFSKEDQMATLVEWTVVSIVKSFEFFPTPPVQMFLCGGGAKNSYLIKRLQFHATQTEIKTTADLNWPVQAVEGAAFAYLAHQRWQNNKLKGSDFTGAKAPVFYGELLTKS